jgi:Uma2 family endonuclease
MSNTALKKDKKYSYDDYKNWQDDERWEIIEGDAYLMSPSPKKKHQIISRNITGVLFQQKEKLQSCNFYEAPMDVIFDDFNVVQPDIFIVCEKDKDSDYVFDVPDVIIEIISKSTAYKDTKIKKDLYEKFGVNEYILVFPELEITERYVLENKKYGSPERFNWDETLKLKTFDIEIDLWEIFEKELPKEKEDEEKTCPFLGDSGCSIYEDRPLTCRYYPIAAGIFHDKDLAANKRFFALIKEDYCLGHKLGKEITVKEWRNNQGIIPYDEANVGWSELILKRKSLGPFIEIPEKSLQIFFMACYNIDRFRRFVFDSLFLNMYVVPKERVKRISEDDFAMLDFAMDWLSTVLLGEKKIEIRKREDEIDVLKEAD